MALDYRLDRLETRKGSCFELGDVFTVSCSALRENDHRASFALLTQLLSLLDLMENFAFLTLVTPVEEK